MSQLSQGQKRRLMYLERKTGNSDNRPAKIGWVTFSKTERLIYYRNQTFQRIVGGGISGNYFELESGDEYWITGVKTDGSNRHPHGSRLIEIDEDALPA